MITKISEEKLYEYLENSKSSILYAYAADVVSRNFRSVHYTTSMIVCDCVLLNVALNEQITPYSADEIIMCIRRRNKAFYTSVDQMLYPIETRFDEYAKTVLGDEYDKVKAMYLRNANFVVYVLSLDLSRNKNCNRRELFLHSTNYTDVMREYKKTKPNNDFD